MTKRERKRLPMSKIVTFSVCFSLIESCVKYLDFFSDTIKVWSVIHVFTGKPY